MTSWKNARQLEPAEFGDVGAKLTGKARAKSRYSLPHDPHPTMLAEPRKAATCRGSRRGAPDAAALGHASLAARAWVSSLASRTDVDRVRNRKTGYTLSNANLGMAPDTAGGNAWEVVTGHNHAREEARTPTCS